MSANYLPYWRYDPDAALRCPNCGWAGCGRGQEEMYEDLFDVCCSGCGEMLLIVSFPTDSETRAAAAAGNPAAQRELPSVDERQAFLHRAADTELRDGAQLPDLAGDEVIIDWDFEEADGEDWTVLRHNGSEIWREIAYYEGYRRFATVFEILRDRYGSRLAEVRPTPASDLFLYGDKLSAPQFVDDLNASLRTDA